MYTKSILQWNIIVTSFLLSKNMNRNSSNTPSDYEVMMFINRIKDKIVLNSMDCYINSELSLIHFIIKIKKYHIHDIKDKKNLKVGNFFYYEGVKSSVIVYGFGVFKEKKPLICTMYFDVTNKRDLDILNLLSKIHKRINIHFVSDLGEYIDTMQVDYYQQEEVKFFIDRSLIYNNQIGEIDFQRSKNDFIYEYSMEKLLEDVLKTKR